MTPRRIAILEDDPVMAEVLVATFEEAGFACRLAETVQAMSDLLQRDSFDLLVLDWLLPDGTAAEVIGLVRENMRLAVPVLIESLADDESVIVKALELGADDYVVKPLRVKELLARVEALVRRSPGRSTTTIGAGPFELDLAQRSLARDGEIVVLTATEFDLATYLFRHLGEVVSRASLLRDVWQTSEALDTRTVDAYVSRLRRKLGLGVDAPLRLLSIHGYGYRLEYDTDCGV